MAVTIERSGTITKISGGTRAEQREAGKKEAARQREEAAAKESRSSKRRTGSSSSSNNQPQYKYELEGKVQTAEKLSDVPTEAKGVVDTNTGRTLSSFDRQQLQTIITPKEQSQQSKFKYQDSTGKVKTADSLSSIPASATGVVDTSTGRTISRTERTSFITQSGQVYRQIGTSFEAEGRTTGEKIVDKVKAGQEVTAGDLIPKGGIELTARNINTLKQTGIFVDNKQIEKRNKEAREEAFKTDRTLITSPRGKFDLEIEKEAEGILARQRAVEKRTKESRENLGLGFLTPSKTDSNLQFAGKYVGNLAYTVSGLGVAELADNILLTAQKAKLSTKATIYSQLGLVDDFTKGAVEDTRKAQIKAGVESISPVKKEDGKFVFNREGTANIISAGVFAGVKTASQLSQVKKAPRTTGKLTDIELKSSSRTVVKTKGSLTAETPIPKSPGTTIIKFSEQKAGIINRLRGKKVETVIKTDPKGNIVKLQKDGNLIYKTTAKAGSKLESTATFRNGKNIYSNVRESTGLSDLNAAISKTRLDTTKSYSKVSSDTVFQQATETGNINIVSRPSAKQTIRGGGLYESKVRVISTASKSKLLKGETVSTISKSPSGKTSTITSEVVKTQSSPTKLNIGSSTTKSNVLKSQQSAPKNLNVDFDITNQRVTGTTQINQGFIKPGEVFSKYVVDTKFSATLQQKNVPLSIRLGEQAKLLRSSKRGQAKTQTSTGATSTVAEVELVSGSQSFRLPGLTNINPPKSGSIPIVPNTIKAQSEPVLSLRPSFKAVSEEDLTQEPGIIIRPSSDVAIKPSLTLTQSEDLKPIQDLNVFTRTRSKNREDVIEEVKTEQLLEEPVIEEIANMEPTITESPFISITKPTSELPILPIATPFLRPERKVSRLAGFNVLVRTKGKFRRINTKALSRAEAVNFGAARVGTTAAATFKVVKSTQQATGQFKGRGNLADFTTKNNVYTEKLGRRIKSQGELREITYKGIGASKSKSKSKKKKSKKKSTSIFGGLF